ncbi:MAG TPA: response regulator [Burkholderiaceae bacterium]|jgi:signal transduction histidine kinase/CheY-like chemotaxis protein
MNNDYLENNSLFLSTLRSDTKERRVATWVVLVSAALFFVMLPFAKLPLQPVKVFIPVYEAALVIIDLMTATLLFGQCLTLRSRALFCLACGYLFAALMEVVHALTFPDAFSASGLLGSGPQTCAWIYVFWHAGFPLFVAGYALLKSESQSAGSARPAIISAVAIMLLLAATLTWAAGADGLPLPELIVANSTTSVLTGTVTCIWAVCLITLILLWRRKPHSVLDLWLIVVMFAWLFDIGLSALFNGGRFDFGYYSGRIYGCVAAGFVLLMLVLENNRLYRLMAEAHIKAKREAQELQTLSARLESANRLLGEKNRQLQTASEMKSEFLANMSHELRTPLNAIIGFSDVMKDGIVGPMAPAQHEYVCEIFESGQHLLSLINDILDLAKIEAGKMNLDLESVDIDSLLRNSLSIIKEKALEKRLDLKLDIAAPLGKVQIDGRKTKQIVFNLLSNAVKYTPDSGNIVLRARLVDRRAIEDWGSQARTSTRMPLPVSAFQRFVEISVSDSGLGIAPEDAPRLFQAFSQLELPQSHAVEGTGLGLVLVMRLAWLHRGTVALASTPGKGSCFTVWLPWRDAAGEVITIQSNALKAALPHLDAEDMGSRSALVIENDQVAADLIASQLLACGYALRHADTAQAALEQLAQGLPDVVVLDILLPDMDGWELLAQIKRYDPAMVKIPVVIVSVVDDRARGFSLGNANVLQKPITRDALMSILGELGLTRKRGSVTVLAIDDDPKAVELVAACLADGPYKVLRAYSGIEGVDVCCREIPDLVVLDLLMPDMNGFDVIAALGARSETASIPIVVVTGKNLNAEEHRLLQSSVAPAGDGLRMKRRATDEAAVPGKVQ